MILALRASVVKHWSPGTRREEADLLPAGVDRRCPVVEPAVRVVVVAVDVAADPASRLVEGLVLVQPYLPFFEFPEPALDEGLALGVAVAAPAVADPELGECRSEAAGGEGGAIVLAERELARLDAVHGGRAFDKRDRFVGAAAQLELPGDDLAGATVDDRHQVAPAVLGDPNGGQAELPQLPRPLDPEEAGPLAPVRADAGVESVSAPASPARRARG